MDLWVNHQFDKLNVYATKFSIIHQRTDLRSDNAYSIMPVIARFNGSGKHQSSPQEARRHVFTIGLDDTGADNVAVALSILGYRVRQEDKTNTAHSSWDLIAGFLEGPFNAYIDYRDVSENFEELSKHTKAPLFILTTQNPTDWASGQVKKNGAGSSATEYYRKQWDAFHQRVMNFFKEKPGRLLTIDVFSGDGWSTLCHYLNKAEPEATFPAPALLQSCDAYKTNGIKRRLVNEARAGNLHDITPFVTPWNYFDRRELIHKELSSERTAYPYQRVDDFQDIDETAWATLRDTFATNLAVFDPRNVSLLDQGGFRMTLQKALGNKKAYTSGSLVTRLSFVYGRFEVVMRAAKGAGAISALFLHRSNPHQEIDLEFLGNETSQLQINVFFNPGLSGAPLNWGNRGTPTKIDLGFDAAEDFHRYSIEWGKKRIRWYVDDRLIHSRDALEPTPIPYLPMQFFVNLWAPKPVELAGQLEPENLPVHADVKSVKIHAAPEANIIPPGNNSAIDNETEQMTFVHER